MSKQSDIKSYSTWAKWWINIPPGQTRHCFLFFMLFCFYCEYIYFNPTVNEYAMNCLVKKNVDLLIFLCIFSTIWTILLLCPTEWSWLHKNRLIWTKPFSGNFWFCSIYEVFNSLVLWIMLSIFDQIGQRVALRFWCKSRLRTSDRTCWSAGFLTRDRTHSGSGLPGAEPCCGSEIISGFPQDAAPERQVNRSSSQLLQLPAGCDGNLLGSWFSALQRS